MNNDEYRAAQRFLRKQQERRAAETSRQPAKKASFLPPPKPARTPNEERARMGIDDELRRAIRTQLEATFSREFGPNGFSIEYGGEFLSRVEPPRPPPATREEQLESVLRVAQGKLREQDEYLKSLGEEPAVYAVVLALGSKLGKCVVRHGGAVLEVNLPASLSYVQPGATVALLKKTMNVFAVVDSPPTIGEVVTVTATPRADACLVGHGPSVRAVLRGVHSPKPGDRVVLDPTASVIVRNLGPEPPAQTFDGATGVTWEDIGGQEAAKEALREALEGPVRHAELYRRYGKKASKGVLLYGPPGNGKTMLGKAAATAIAELHGASSAQSGYQYVKGPELLNQYVGASEANVRRLFDGARRHKETHGYPAIVFIDEAEALLSTRGERGGVLTSTIVPMFLAEMDGLSDSGAFVLLATNRPDVLDPAIVREGRIDRKVRVGRPDKETARAIFTRYLSDRPLAAELGELADGAVEDLYDGAHALYRIQRTEGPPKTVALRDLTSGAQIAGLVESATQHAIRRELAGGAGGIGLGDVRSAIAQTLEEQRNAEHRAELADIVEPIKATVSQIERIRARPSAS